MRSCIGSATARSQVRSPCHGQAAEFGFEDRGNDKGKERTGGHSPGKEDRWAWPVMKGGREEGREKRIERRERRGGEKWKGEPAGIDEGEGRERAEKGKGREG